MAISFHLSKFKNRGLIAYDKILAISQNDRIPALVQKEDGREEVLIALTAALNSAFKNINLRVGLNEDQLIDLADAIIETSYEDYLSIEDVLLFLQKLLMGEMGKIYDRMDIPTFFEKFEIYRQQRHKALIRLREEQHVQNKSYGSPERYSDMSKEEERNAFHEAMKGYVKFTPNDNTVSGDQGTL